MVESFFNEISPLFGFHLTINAGDQVIFGDKILYNHVSTAGSSGIVGWLFLKF